MVWGRVERVGVEFDPAELFVCDDDGHTECAGNFGCTDRGHCYRGDHGDGDGDRKHGAEQ